MATASHVERACYALQIEAQKMLDGVLPDPELFALIYTIDADDDWTSKLALRKANPNHDVSVSGEYGYTINQHMPVMGVSPKSVLFGDFEKYLIRDVMAVTLFRFADSRYLEKGQVAFLAWSRHDGDLIDDSNDALKFFQHAAA